MSYYDAVNSTLLERVEPSARTILEVGCAAGALARAIRDKLGAGVFYAGVELVPEQLARAAPALDAAIQCDVEQLSNWDDDIRLRPIVERRFDHIIFGDVLEHLREPERVLAQAVRYLAPGGTVLACIPNVQHWSVFAQLLSGSWPRVDTGLFDRTHLRWFALADMVALMNGAGLTVDSVVSRVFDLGPGREIMEYLEPLALHLGIDFDRLMEQSMPLQYVLVARPATPAG